MHKKLIGILICLEVANRQNLSDSAAETISTIMGNVAVSIVLDIMHYRMIRACEINERDYKKLRARYILRSKAGW